MRVLRPAQALAAIAGLLFGLSGAVVEAPRSADEPGAVVACVNGVRIREPALERALGRRRAALGSSFDPALRGDLIDHLVDEELLVQRAAEMGLVESDRGVRKALARAAIEAAVRDAATRPPTQRELRQLHADNADLFSLPRRARVRTISFDASLDASEALRRAQRVAAAISSGMAFATAATRFGDRPGLPVPDALLPEAALRRQLGPALSDAALALAAGEVSAPIRSGASFHLLELSEVVPERAQTFETARAQVAAEFERQRADRALAALLARLRARARVVLAPELRP